MAFATPFTSRAKPRTLLAAARFGRYRVVYAPRRWDILCNAGTILPTWFEVYTWAKRRKGVSGGAAPAGVLAPLE